MKGDSDKRCEVCGRRTRNPRRTKCARCDYLTQKFEEESAIYLEKWITRLMLMQQWRLEDKENKEKLGFLKNPF